MQALLTQPWSVLGVILLLAGGAVVARGTGRKASSELWRETAEAEEARRKQLEEQVSGLQIEVTALRSQLTVLQDLVTGTHAVEALRDFVAIRFDRLDLALERR